ncbi:MAG: 4Fe-4S binding protein [Eubacteriales bacterium]|nr:4Fe-4S binding protein [Eubacteriales bacterium]
MIRQVIKIDEEKCNGCGICANACHESAIAMVNGKARLIRDDYCDGMGDCLPGCPTGAISFETREALEYDREAVEANMRKKKLEQEMAQSGNSGGGCPGSRMRELKREKTEAVQAAAPVADTQSSQLTNWPVQLKLAPIQAPYFSGARLLIAADCTAYAYASMHKDFMRGRATLIGCPKLDACDYSEKLTEIIRSNDIKDVTIVRMEVPCCGGLVHAAKQALQDSGKFLPWQVVTISVDGEILDN